MATLDRQDYISKMDHILSDRKKFTIVNLKDDTLLNFVINKEKQLIKFSKNLLSLAAWQKKTGNC